jgi:putative hydrolase of the HAD superfamily
MGVSKAMNVISFDLDGTLTTPAFVDAVWRVGIPQHYAAQRAISLEKAREYIFSLYDAMGDHDLNWYDLPFWLAYLKLAISPEQLLADFRHLIALYPDVLPVLASLQGFYKLIIISNANRLFLDLEVSATGIGRFFNRIFSVTSDFGRVKREEDIYQQVCAHLGIPPAEILHVGDHREFDFDAPRRVGMHAYLIDRSRHESGPYVIHSLDELVKIISIESLPEFYL